MFLRRVYVLEQRIALAQSLKCAEVQRGLLSAPFIVYPISSPNESTLPSQKPQLFGSNCQLLGFFSDSPEAKQRRPGG